MDSSSWVENTHNCVCFVFLRYSLVSASWNDSSVRQKIAIGSSGTMWVWNQPKSSRLASSEIIQDHAGVGLSETILHGIISDHVGSSGIIWNHFVWDHLRSCGINHLGSSWTMWYHRGSSGIILPDHLRSSGIIWNHPGSSELIIWDHLGSPRLINWDHLGWSSGISRDHLGSSGIIWDHLGSSEIDCRFRVRVQILGFRF